MIRNLLSFLVPGALVLGACGCAASRQKLEIEAGVPGIGKVSYSGDSGGAAQSSPCVRMTFFDGDGAKVGSATSGSLPGNVPIPKGAAFVAVEQIDCGDVAPPHPSVRGGGERLVAFTPHLVLISPVGEIHGRGDFFALLSGIGDMTTVAQNFIRGWPRATLPVGVTVHYAFSLSGSKSGMTLVFAEPEPIQRIYLLLNGKPHELGHQSRGHDWSFGAVRLPWDEFVTGPLPAVNSLEFTLDTATQQGVRFAASYTLR